MKIKAAIFEQVGQPLVIDDVELAGPGAGEVLFRMVATGVCHTDMYSMSGADPSAYWPAILGHEGGGIVEAVGPGVESIRPGDHVVNFFKPHCGACECCAAEQTNQCQANGETSGRGLMRDGQSRITRGGETIRHFMGCSSFAEATVVNQENLAVVAADAPLDRVCLLGCGVTTGVGAALWTAQVQSGSVCAVLGCGGVGMSAIQGCRMAGAERIIAVDTSPARLEQTAQFGATEQVLGGADTVEQIMALTGGRGVDYAFEATGNVGVMGQALESTRIGGGTCCVIGVAGKGEAIQVVPRNLILGRRLIGSSFGGAKGKRDIPLLVERYQQGDLLLDELASARLPLDQINDAFALMERQVGFRTVIVFD